MLWLIRFRVKWSDREEKKVQMDNGFGGEVTYGTEVGSPKVATRAEGREYQVNCQEDLG